MMTPEPCRCPHCNVVIYPVRSDTDARLMSLADKCWRCLKPLSDDG